MTVSITIRNVSNETRDALAARAASSGRSLQEFLSSELRELAAKPQIEDALANARARARTYPPMENAEILRHIAADRE
jgi:plasmid stability protein